MIFLYFLLCTLFHFSSATSLLPYPQNVPPRNTIQFHSLDPYPASSHTMLSRRMEVEPEHNHVFIRRGSPPDSSTGPPSTIAGPSQISQSRSESPLRSAAQPVPWPLTDIRRVHRPYPPTAASSPYTSASLSPPQTVTPHQAATLTLTICNAYTRARNAWASCTLEEKTNIISICCRVAGFCMATQGSGMAVQGFLRREWGTERAGYLLFGAGIGVGCLARGGEVWEEEDGEEHEF
jgi:hypothetical protein